MKKIALALSVSTVFSSYILANDDIVTKISNFYSIVTNGAVSFESKKSGDDTYDLKIIPKSMELKEILNPNYRVKLKVDEGPLVKTPHFTFAKAGLSTNINLFKLFNKDIEKSLNKNIKKAPVLHYGAIVGFSNTLQESFKVDAINIEDNDTVVSISPIKANSSVNLDNYTGSIDVSLEKVEIKPKKEKGFFLLEGIKAHNEINQKPINGVALFGKSSLKIEKFELKAQGQSPINLKFSFEAGSEIKKVNEKLLDFTMNINTKSDDVDTIALAKGIKDEKLNLSFKNLGTEGVLDLVEYSKKMQELQDEFIAASNDPAKKEQAVAAYMMALTSLNNSIVPIINKTFISNKSKLVLDLELLSDKKSFVKLDLLYKAKPLSGDINSAMISLMAQGLAIFDGDFEVQLDSSLANAAYPMSGLVLEMLKNKGFATEKNGIYHLKGKLKDGKVIINGKAYTLQELSTTLF